MSKPNPVDLIAESEAMFEAEEAEPADPAISAPSRPNRAKSVVYSIRLNPDEVQRLEELADATGIPASTLARGYILEGIAANAGDDLRAALERIERDLLAVKRKTLSA